MTGAHDIDDLLHGWDVAFSATMAEVNRAIADAGSSPEGFEVKGGAMGDTKGVFDPWRLVPDVHATGNTIVIELPARDMILEINGRSIDVPDQSFLAEVRLEFVAAGTNVNGQTVQRLQIKAPPEGDLVNPYVEVRKNYRDEVQAQVASLLQTWLKENIGQFTHVFAEAIVDGADENPVFDRLMPVQVDFAVDHPDTDATPENSIISILGLLEKTFDTPPVAQTTAALLPEGAHRGLAISSAAVLEHVFAPIALRALSAQPEARLRIKRGAAVSLVNETELLLPELDLTGVGAGGVSSTPTLAPGDFVMSIYNQHLTLKLINLHFSNFFGLNTFSMNYSGSYGLDLQDSGHLGLIEPDDPTVSIVAALSEVGREVERWTGVVVTILIAALCLIPGAGQAAKLAEEGITVGEDALEAAATASSDLMDEASVLEADEASGEELTQELTAEAEGGAALQQSTSIKSLFIRFGKKLVKGLAIGFAVLGTTKLPEIVAFLQNKADNPAPTTHDLAESLCSIALWNGKESGPLECISAEFQDGLILGLRVVSDPDVKKA